MSSTERAAELVAVLNAGGMVATSDPRSATPPCVLVVPLPGRTYDLGCGYSARWELWALAPGPGNADAAKALDGMADRLAELLPVERADLSSYALSPDNPPFPAYRIEFLEGVS